MKFYEEGQPVSVEEVEREWHSAGDTWDRFKALIRPGDEVRWFSSVQGPRAARFGFVLVRPGPSLDLPEATEHPVCYYLVGMA